MLHLLKCASKHTCSIRSVNRRWVAGKYQGRRPPLLWDVHTPTVPPCNSDLAPDNSWLCRDPLLICRLYGVFLKIDFKAPIVGQKDATLFKIPILQIYPKGWFLLNIPFWGFLGRSKTAHQQILVWKSSFIKKANIFVVAHLRTKISLFQKFDIFGIYSLELSLYTELSSNFNNKMISRHSSSQFSSDILGIN